MTAIAALTALMVAVVLAFAAERLTPSDTPAPPPQAETAPVTAPAEPPAWVTDPLAPPTRIFAPAAT